MKTYTLIKFHKIQRNYYYFYIIYILLIYICTYVNNKSMNSITEIHTCTEIFRLSTYPRGVFLVFCCVLRFSRRMDPWKIVDSLKD